jgi:hypothetical protein
VHGLFLIALAGLAVVSLHQLTLHSLTIFTRVHLKNVEEAQKLLRTGNLNSGLQASLSVGEKFVVESEVVDLNHQVRRIPLEKKQFVDQKFMIRLGCILVRIQINYYVRI